MQQSVQNPFFKRKLGHFEVHSLSWGQTSTIVASRGLHHTGEPYREQNNTGEASASMEYVVFAFERHNVLHMLGMVSMVSLC